MLLPFVSRRPILVQMKTNNPPSLLLQVSLSVTLDPRKFDNFDLGLDQLKADLGRIAKVTTRTDLSIISL